MFFHNGVLKPIGYKYLINRASKGEPIELWGDPNAVKDMVYVKDYCQMIYRAIVATVKSGTYNVGTGIGTSLLEQIEGMIAVFSPHGHPSEIIMRPDKPSAPSYIMNIDNARRELGYKPCYTYIEMLEDIKKEREINRII